MTDVFNEQPGADLSPWYKLSLGLGCAGLAFLFIGAWAGWQTAHGLDPLDGIGNAGAVGTILCFLIIYGDIGTRWKRFPIWLRIAFSRSIFVILLLSVVVTAYETYQAFFEPAKSCSNRLCDEGWQRDFIMMALFCCVSTVIWLLRFRRRI